MKTRFKKASEYKCKMVVYSASISIDIYVTETIDCQSDNSVVTGGTASCHYDNLWCHKWQQNCEMDDRFFFQCVETLKFSWMLHEQFEAEIHAHTYPNWAQMTQNHFLTLTHKATCKIW